MKKRLLIIATLVIGAVLTTNAQQIATLNLNGTLVTRHQKVYLQKYIDRYYEVVDSAVVENGKFSFHSKVILPEIYGLSTNLKDTPFLVFLDEGNIQVNLNPESGYHKSVTTGSTTHDLYREFNRNRNNDLTTFIQHHEYVSRLSSAQIIQHLELLDDNLKKKSYAEILRKVIDSRKVTDVGQKAPNFSAKDIDGKTVSLSDFTGKGYLLIDFWASWCVPCRKENPNVVEAYNKYHDKGFDILAISLDKTKEAWLRGIEQDGLKYHHVSELQYWNSDIVRLYGIRSIPSNLLIDKEGKIIAKNLRGEELHEFLSQLLK